MSIQLIKFLSLTGLTWLIPFVRLCAGDNPQEQFKQIWLTLMVPVLAFFLFLAVWSASAAQVQTSLGTIPGPKAVWQELQSLIQDHQTDLYRPDYHQLIYRFYWFYTGFSGCHSIGDFVRNEPNSEYRD
jgi:nitrate/nitrite transport system permease protein